MSLLGSVSVERAGASAVAALAALGAGAVAAAAVIAAGLAIAIGLPLGVGVIAVLAWAAVRPAAAGVIEPALGRCERPLSPVRPALLGISGIRGLSSAVALA